MTYRIFFDTNEGSQEHGYFLWLERSKRDLEKWATLQRMGPK